MRMSSRGDAEEGAAAVEFALLLFPFVIIVFGIISGGIVFNDKLAITQGAREGARYGATLTPPPTLNDTASMTTFLTLVRTQAKADTYGTLGSGATTVCVGFIPSTAGMNSYYLTDSAGTAAVGNCPNSPNIAGSIVVTVRKPFTFNLMLASFGGPLQSNAVARYESKS